MIGEIRQNFTEASASVGLILAMALVTPCSPLLPLVTPLTPFNPLYPPAIPGNPLKPFKTPCNLCRLVLQPVTYLDYC